MNVKITRITEESGIDDLGKPIINIRLDFNVGANGPFAVRIPKAQFTSALANQRVQEFVAHIQGITGLSA